MRIALAQPPADGHAIDARQHDVEHDGIEARRGQPCERIVAAPSDVDVHARLDQAAGDQVAQLRVIFDDEHVHTEMFTPGGEVNMRARTRQISGSQSHLIVRP
jgi:hypothetical protein